MTVFLEHRRTQPQATHQQALPLPIADKPTRAAPAPDADATHNPDTSATAAGSQRESEAIGVAPDYFSTRLSTHKLRAF